MSDPLQVVNELAASVTQDTHGVVVYQEQISLMLRKLGFTWAEADKWNKSLKINSKSIADWEERVANNELYKKFVALICGQYGISEADAWRFVERFTSYSFNKGHAVGYAMTAYQQMWLRVHYPIEYWCAALSEENDERKRAAYMVAAARDGVLILPPHVNGTASFSIEDNAVRIGTQSIKHVGDKAAAALQAARPFQSAEDLSVRVPRRTVNSRSRGALESAGALEFDQGVQVEQAAELNRMLRESKINLSVYQRGKAVAE